MSFRGEGAPGAKLAFAGLLAAALARVAVASGDPVGLCWIGGVGVHGLPPMGGREAFDRVIGAIEGAAAAGDGNAGELAFERALAPVGRRARRGIGDRPPLGSARSPGPRAGDLRRAGDLGASAGGGARPRSHARRSSASAARCASARWRARRWSRPTPTWCGRRTRSGSPPSPRPGRAISRRAGGRLVDVTTADPAGRGGARRSSSPSRRRADELPHRVGAGHRAARPRARPRPHAPPPAGRGAALPAGAARAAHAAGRAPPQPARGSRALRRARAGGAGARPARRHAVHPLLAARHHPPLGGVGGAGPRPRRLPEHAGQAAGAPGGARAGPARSAPRAS